MTSIDISKASQAVLAPDADDQGDPNQPGPSRLISWRNRRRADSLLASDRSIVGCC